MKVGAITRGKMDKAQLWKRESNRNWILNLFICGVIYLFKEIY